MTPIPASHAHHDPLAIAAHAAGDAEGAELDAALALVAACADCAALHHDLRSIAAALPALPDPVRRRDFRLTPGQAATLRPSAWRRLLAPLAGPRFAFAGPLGTGLATLGIAGFLVAGAVGMPLAGTAAAPGTAEASEDLAALNRDAAATAAPAPEAPAVAGSPAASLEIGAVPANDGPTGDGTGYGPVGSGAGGVVVGAGQAAASAGTDATTTGSGAEGPMVLASPDPKASVEQDRLAGETPDEHTAFELATQAPVPTAPATTPLVVLAAVLLSVGTVLGGLRLLARRAA